MPRKSQAEIKAEVRSAFRVKDNAELVEELLQRTREDPQYYGAIAQQTLRRLQEEHTATWTLGSVVMSPRGRGVVVPVADRISMPDVRVRLDHDGSEHVFLADELRKLSLLEQIAEAAQDD